MYSFKEKNSESETSPSSPSSEVRVFAGSLITEKLVKIEGLEPIVSPNGAVGFDARTLAKVAFSQDPETIIWINLPEKTNNRQNDTLQLADGRLEHDAEGTVVIVDGIDIGLSAKEYEIFNILADNYKKTVSRDQLASEVWDGYVGNRAVDVNIYNIRNKLGDLYWIVKTMHGLGYKLDDNADTKQPLPKQRDKRV
jgi:DNA-binding winged helix-turn-helix (wHTH) protein